MNVRKLSRSLLMGTLAVTAALWPARLALGTLRVVPPRPFRTCSGPRHSLARSQAPGSLAAGGP